MDKEPGPVLAWSAAFVAEFGEAERNGTVEILAHDWAAHAEVGRALVRDLLEVVGGMLPKDERVLRDIFRQVIDVASTLHSGITVIEAHLAAFGL